MTGTSGESGGLPLTARIFPASANPAGYRCRQPHEERDLIEACVLAASQGESRKALSDLYVPGQIDLEAFRNLNLYRAGSHHIPTAIEPTAEQIDNEMGFVRWASDYHLALSSLAGNPSTCPQVVTDVVFITRRMIEVSTESVSKYDWGNRDMLRMMQQVLAVAARRNDLTEDALQEITDAVRIVLSPPTGFVRITTSSEEVVEPLLNNTFIEPKWITGLFDAVWSEGDWFSAQELASSPTYWTFERLWEPDYDRVDVLSSLAESQNPAAQYYAARSRNTPSRVLTQMMGSPDLHPDVLAAIAGNDALPLESAVSLVGADSYTVRANALVRVARESRPTSSMVASCFPVDVLSNLQGPLNDPPPPSGTSRHEWNDTGIPFMIANAQAFVTDEVLAEWSMSPDPEDQERASLYITLSATC